MRICGYDIQNAEMYNGSDIGTIVDTPYGYWL